tara:strand:+ start:483 stop:1181 length:699 start_codon:yes stop_codon:yes gene_type:complete
VEKLLYPVWKNPTIGGDEFGRLLTEDLTPLLKDLGCKKLRISVMDSSVKLAMPRLTENSGPAMDAMISIWIDSSVYRHPFEQAIDEYVSRKTGYLVTESEPLVNDSAPRDENNRVEGICHVVFLTHPPRLSYEQWLDIWHNSHTQIAIDTQSTFGYRQNVIVRRLTYGAPPFDAIIEENFPIGAMDSNHVFYEAEGDDAKLAQNLKAMMDSCARFIDFDKIDIIPTSEYLFD